jgi:hypothetical protein
MSSIQYIPVKKLTHNSDARLLLQTTWVVTVTAMLRAGAPKRTMVLLEERPLGVAILAVPTAGERRGHLSGT